MQTHRGNFLLGADILSVFGMEAKPCRPYVPRLSPMCRDHG